MHKDGFLTLGESQAAPPPLDRKSAVFLDVDGTLLEIAPRPDLVRVPVGLPDLLAQIAAEREDALALISGRPLEQIDRLLRPWRGAAGGTHGIERRRADGTLASVLDRAGGAGMHRLTSALDAGDSGE